MALRAVVFCTFAVVVQQCVAQSCYLPIKPSCGCSSGKVIVTEVDEIDEITYRPSVSTVSVKQGYSGPCLSIDVPNSGGALGVTSIGSIAPTGIAVATDLNLAGDLVVSGEVPYLTAVSFDGLFDTKGSAPVSYGCGDGCIAITQEIGNPSGVNAAVGSRYTTINTCGCDKLY